MAELRRLRSLLTGINTSASAPAHRQPPSELQRRLVSIAEESADDPLWARPFRRVPDRAARGSLPSPRRRLRRRAVVLVSTLGTLAVVGTGAGFAAAPRTVAAVADPNESAQAGFARARAEVPLSGDVALAATANDQASAQASGRVTAEATGAGGAFAGVGLGSTANDPASDAVAYRSVSAVAGVSGVSLTAYQAATVLDASQQVAGSIAYSGVERVITRSGSSLADLRYTATVSAVASDLQQHGTSNGAPSTGTTTTAGKQSISSTLAANYRLGGATGVTMFGRPAVVIEARTFGESATGAPSARWWIDQQTGLLLGRQTYDRSGALIRSAMMTALTTTGVPSTGAWLAPSGKPTSTESLTRVASSQVSVFGWHCPQTLAGLPLIDVRTDVATDPGVVHLVYGDGIWTVSVFERRGVLSGAPAGSAISPQLDAYLSAGSPQTASWQSGDAVITVVSDGPDSLLSQIVMSLPHDPHRTPTTMERVQAGWSRIFAVMFG